LNSWGQKKGGASTSAILYNYFQSMTHFSAIDASILFMGIDASENKSVVTV
jgi:hypothetical protein